MTVLKLKKCQPHECVSLCACHSDRSDRHNALCPKRLTKYEVPNSSLTDFTMPIFMTSENQGRRENLSCRKNRIFSYDENTDPRFHSQSQRRPPGMGDFAGFFRHYLRAPANFLKVTKSQCYGKLGLSSDPMPDL